MAAPSSTAFADLLRHQRIAAGLTQEELAARAHLSVDAISTLERGVRLRPRKDTVLLLADALGLAAGDRAQFTAAAHYSRGTQPSHARAASGLTATAHSRISVPELIGRADELALMERHLGAEGAGLLLVAGEPGIGKSRLLRETGQRAAEAGWTVLYGECMRQSTREPYAPLVEALACWVRQRPRARLRLDLKGCGWLAHLLPELADNQLMPAPTWIPPAEQARRLIFAAVARFLANIAGPAGTLLVLDDMQWAGQDALDLLVALVRAGAAGSLRVVGAYRDTEVRPEDPLRVTLADLGRLELVREIGLGPLAPHESAELLSVLLEGRELPDAGADIQAFVDRVLRRAGGVPFFLVSCAQEYALSMQASAPEEPSREDVPWTVVQQIRQRVAALPRAAQELLGIAAVVGRVVPGSVLTAVAGWPEPAVLDALDVACQARLLVAEEREEAEGGRNPVTVAGLGAGEWYRFAHDLIEEVVGDGLNATRRRVLHRRVAEALDQQLAEGERQRWAAKLAWHFARAGQEARAMPYALLAGDGAQAVHARQEAEGHYHMALELALALGDKVREAEALEKLGRVLGSAVRYDEALQVLERSIEAYGAIGDRQGELRAAIALGFIHAVRGAPADGIALLHTLGHRLEADAPDVLARLYAELADLYYKAGLYGDGLQVAEQAVQFARAAGNIRLLLRAEVGRGQGLTALGQLEAGIGVLESTLAQAEMEGDLGQACNLCANLGELYCLQGAFDKSRHSLARALHLAERLSNPIRHSYIEYTQGECRFFWGQWQQVRIDCEHARARLDALGTYYESKYPALFLGILNLAQGQWELASAYLDAAITAADGEGDLQALRFAHPALAERELLERQPQRARARLEPLLDRPGTQETLVTLVLPLLVWADLELEGPEHTTERASQMISRARAEANHLALVDGLRVQALVFMRQTCWLEAADALEEALRRCRAMPYPYAEAKVLYVYGSLYVAMGKPEIARQRFEQALAILNRLGERLYAQRVEQSLAGLGDS